MESKSPTYQAPVDELAAHLAALQRQECYVVDEVLKQSLTEVTQRVHFEGANGAAQGPFIRKRIKRAQGLGSAYERIFAAQQAGKRFQFIPRIYDCAEFGDEIVVVMELVSGETLDEVIYRCDPSMALAVDVFPRLCDAVAELHERFDPPIVHRDLKPGNIMLSSNSLTIIDFGISRTCKDGAQTDTTHFGTRAYAPPEQFGFAQTTVRSDVYALGLLLYYCLVERVPDAAARECGFADANIPEPVRRVIAKAAEFDPKQRYASVRELKAAFERAVHETGFVLVGRGVPAPVPVAAAEDANAAPRSRGGRAKLAGPWAKAREKAAGQGPHAAIQAGDPKRQDRYRVGVDPTQAADIQRAAKNASSLFSSFVQGTKTLLRSVSVPKGLGIAWNVLVLLAYALLLLACIFMPLDPETVIDPRCPVWFVRMEYWFMMPVTMGAFVYAILDRRRLQKRFPVLARLNWWQTFLAAACIASVAIVITYIAGMPYIQAGVVNVYVNTN